MREQIRDKGRLEHILSAISHIENYTTGISKETLISSPLHLHATVYNVQIIGEAVYNLSQEFKSSHPQTPWLMIEKMRHILVHDYYKINNDVLWSVITDDLQSLKMQVQEYLTEP